MATIPSFIEEIHGVLAYQPEILELDNPWDGPGPYTYSKTWPKLPEDFRCELIEGHIIMSPAANFDHQRLTMILVRMLLPLEEAHGGTLITAPFDVVLDLSLVLQPDLLYIAADEAQAIKRTLHGAPELAVEIISPSSPRIDRDKKFKLYQKYKVPEYWIFDPETESADFFVLGRKGYKQVAPIKNVYQSPRYDLMKIDLQEVWRRFHLRGKKP